MASTNPDVKLIVSRHGGLKGNRVVALKHVNVGRNKCGCLGYAIEALLMLQKSAAASTSAHYLSVVGRGAAARFTSVQRSLPDVAGSPLALRTNIQKLHAGTGQTELSARLMFVSSGSTSLQ